MSQTPPGRRRVVELFAGVGGFRLGLEPSGWETVWANQWEPSTTVQHAFDCYTRHFPVGESVCEDIHEVMNDAEAGRRSIPDHELLVGGFPCQDYSVAKTLNQAAGIVGRKGVLWWEIYRLLMMKRPRYLFLENVDRLLKSPASRRGRDFAVMLAALANLEYEVEWRVVNAADYGYPQKRRRVLLIGKHMEGAMSDPEAIFSSGVLARALPTKPTPSIDEGEPDLIVEGDPADVTTDYRPSGKKSPFLNAGFMSHGRVWTIDVEPHWDGPFATLGDVLEPVLDVPEDYFVPESDLERWKYLKGAKREPRTHKASGTPYYYVEGPIPYPDRTDWPSRTVLTGEGGRTPSRFKHLVQVEDGRYRRLTSRELERLNGFDDDWTDTGMPKGRRAFMMGNALVVGLVERVGSELLRELPGEPSSARNGSSD